MIRIFQHKRLEYTDYFLNIETVQLTLQILYKSFHASQLIRNTLIDAPDSRVCSKDLLTIRLPANVFMFPSIVKPLLSPNECTTTDFTRTASRPIPRAPVPARVFSEKKDAWQYCERGK